MRRSAGAAWTLGHVLLWAGWGLAYAIALTASGVFVQGVLRDTGAGEASVPLDLSSPGAWVSSPFRLWGAGTHRLLLSSVNHDRSLVGAPLAGAFEFAIVDPDGESRVQGLYRAGDTDHRLPDGYGDSLLGRVELDDRPIRRWTLRARVLEADPRFATARSSLRLTKERYDPGMGGLINYAMMIPAVLFIAIAFATALSLSRRGHKTPLILTSLSLALVLLASTVKW